MSDIDDQAEEHVKGRTWISPDIFESNLRPKGWKDDPELRAGVDWLLSFMPAHEWKRRRFSALRHFIDAVSGESADPSGKGRFFNDRDRFAWYLFLGKAVLDHPMIYDCMFGSRVIPVLTAIGRNLEMLKGVAGIEARVRRMAGPEKSQPNACLFELLVAAAYCRQGARVRFLEERPGVAKTHDMDIDLSGTTWAVECKRLEGGEYSEAERARARELWLPVAHELYRRRLDCLFTVEFLVELSAVPLAYVAQKTGEWMRSGGLFAHSWSDSISVGRVERLNLRPLQTMLKSDDVAMNSSRMHELLTGRYKRNAHIITSLRVRHADNPVYIKECDAGCVFDWDSRSEVAIDKRARDVFKRVAEGCRQLPDGRPGIVHIGFEAVDGDEVERRRYDKILQSLKEFDPEGKALEYVYVNWLAPESPPDELFAFDETCHHQAIRPQRIRPLLNGFLVLPSDLSSRPGAHWKL
jgi:hypothetical protein